MSYRRFLSGLAFTLATATASAAPVVLDSEQKAAAGVAAAFFTSHEVPLMTGISVETVRRQVELALDALQAATTPELLIATRGDITIPCAAAGTLKARMSKALPRVLRLQWDGCVMDVLGYQRTYNGPAAITLVADTFEPERVTSIRLGNASGDFTEQLRTESPEQIDNITKSINLLVRGDISMERAFGGFGEVVGQSSYELHGFTNEDVLLEFPTGEPSQQYTYRVDMKRLTVIESTTISDTGMLYDEDLQLLSGRLSIIQEQPFYGVTTQAYKFNGYHVRVISDWDVFSSQTFVNGRINVTWNPNFGSGCTDGVYAFKTRAPLIRSFNSEILESGHLVVNGTARARFYTADNVPRRLPTPVNGMLVNLQVDDLGTFNYDAPSLWFALYPAAQCHP